MPISSGGSRPVLIRNAARACRSVDQCDLLGLKQYVTSATRGSNILDLVLARGLSRVCAVPRLSSLSSDHYEVIISFLCTHTSPVLATRSTALCYRRADFDGLRNALKAAPWEMLDGMELDEAVSLFYTLVDGAVRDYVPTVTMKRRFPPWFDTSVRRALRLKQAAFMRLKRHPGDEHIETDFARKRSDFKRLSRDSYNKYLTSLVSDFSTNPKRFWTF